MKRNLVSALALSAATMVASVGVSSAPASAASVRCTKSTFNVDGVQGGARVECTGPVIRQMWTECSDGYPQGDLYIGPRSVTTQYCNYGARVTAIYYSRL
jgi:hypothetical protein